MSPRMAALACLALWAGCSSSEPATQPPLPQPRVELSVLATAHEARELVPEGGVEGGAASMLGYWREHETPCRRGVACAFLPLSLGDHFSEGALVQRFQGEPAAEALAQMGYVASAIGKTDLAFGAPRLARNVERSKVPHLAALGGEWGQGLVPSLRLERAGVKVEVLGLSGAADGGKLFERLNDWSLGLQSRGVEAGIAISDRCVSELVGPVERGGRDWPYLVLVIGQACGQPQPKSPIYSIALMAAGEGLTGYARARLTFDGGTHALLQAATSVVDIRGSAPKPDASLQAKLAAWQTRH